MHNAAYAILTVGTLVFLAHVFSEFFNRTKVPDVLLLLGIGLLAGPVAGLIKPEQFGSIGAVFTTITLIVILFEGGLDLSSESIRKSFNRSMLLTVTVYTLTTGAVAALAWFLTELQPIQCLILGSVVAPTSPAIVVPLARALGLSAESRSLLSMESAVSDVLSIVITFTLLGILKGNQAHIGIVLGQISASFILASIIGLAAAIIWSSLLEKMRTLKNSMFTTPAFIFVIFGLTEILGFSGYIASFTFGITLGNIEIFSSSPISTRVGLKASQLTENENSFLKELVFLLRTFFFVYIGISMKFSESWALIVGLIFSATIMIIRTVVCRITLHKDTPRIEAATIGIMAPRGLATAAMAGIALQQGIPGGEVIQSAAFSVVLFCMIFTSAGVYLLGRLGLRGPYRFLMRAFPDMAPQPDVRTPDLVSDFPVGQTEATGFPTLGDDFDETQKSSPEDTPD